MRAGAPGRLVAVASLAGALAGAGTGLCAISPLAVSGAVDGTPQLAGVRYPASSAIISSVVRQRA